MKGNISISVSLLKQLKAFDIDPNEAIIGFFYMAQKMLSCPGNYREAYQKANDDRIHVLRDYYPNTKFMFKMTIVKFEYEDYSEDVSMTKQGCNIKVRSIDADSISKWGYKKKGGALKFDIADLSKKLGDMSDGMLLENNFTKLNLLPKDFKIKAPMRMFPKGYK